MKIHVIITMLALFAFLIAAVWYARKQYKINFAVLGLGAVAFFASSQVLEKIVHLLVLHPQKDGTVLWLLCLKKQLDLFSLNGWRRKELWKIQMLLLMDWGMVV